MCNEKHEYRGAAIKQWINEAFSKYIPNADVTNLAKVGDQPVPTDLQFTTHCTGWRSGSGSPAAEMAASILARNTRASAVWLNRYVPFPVPGRLVRHRWRAPSSAAAGISRCTCG